MPIDGIGAAGASPSPLSGNVPSGPGPSGDPATPASEGAVAGGSFAQALRRRLAEPRSGVDRVRAEIEAIRSGQALRPQGGPSFVQAPTSPQEVTTAYMRSPGGPDPFGWRDLARQLGETVVGPGFGPIFERQIHQESGFDPDVAYGMRVSSAGAEGIAQLMPQYYPHVDRTNPQEALVAGAKTMQHYMEALDGDVRKALAAYNAGLGTVQSLTRQLGPAWEQGLPDETKLYLRSILGGATPYLPTSERGDVAVFGGQGPGGVLVPPLGAATEQRSDGLAVLYRGAAGHEVRAPAEGLVVAVRPSATGATVVIDHGGGWLTTLEGVLGVEVTPGDSVARSQTVGGLAPDAGSASGWLRLGVSLDGRPLDASRYVLRS